MWPLLILAGVAAALFFAPSSSTPATATKPIKVTAANIASNWPAHMVIDTTKFKGLGYTVNVSTQYEGVDPKVVAKMMQTNPAVANTFLGPVPIFVAAQLAANQRVWVGTPVQDETSQTPSAYLPIYIGSTPPSGFVEVLAS